MQLTFIHRLAGFRRKIRLKNSKNNLSKVQSDDKFDFLLLKWISLKLFELFYSAEKLLPKKPHIIVSLLSSYFDPLGIENLRVLISREAP